MTKEQTNIDDLMWRKRMSHSDLAEKIGISNQSLYARLRGEISMNTIELLAKAFNVSIADIVSKSNKFKFIELNTDKDSYE
jgi:DNA-binding Xre family transcriptional regulator